MKFDELSEKELTQVNGGVLGLNGLLNRNGSSSSGFVLLEGLEVNFTMTSTGANGSSQTTSFGLSLSDLLGFQNASQN